MAKTDSQARATAKYHKEKTTVIGIRYTNEEAEKVESFCAFMHSGKSEIFKKAIREMAEKYGWDWDKQLEK